MLPDSASLEEEALTLERRGYTGCLSLLSCGFDSCLMMCCAIDLWTNSVTRRPYAIDPAFVTPLVLSWYRDLTCTYILIDLYLPDRLSALPDSARSLPLSRYLAALLHCVSFVLTFLFSLAFSHLHCLLCRSHLPVFLTCMSHYCSYLLILFCYLLSTILRISQLVTKLLIYLLTVL